MSYIQTRRRFSIMLKMLKTSAIGHYSLKAKEIDETNHCNNSINIFKSELRAKKTFPGNSKC